MTTEEKLITIAENEEKVFEAGVSEGRKAAYDEFWDVFQDYGNRRVYYNAFYGTMSGELKFGWNDKTYNPKYHIKTMPIYANGIYYYNTQITDIKVDIEINGNGEITNTFANCYSLATIPLLRLIGNHTFKNTFGNCSKLKNITIEGIIGSSINFQYSPLSSVSIVSIIEHLSDNSEGMTLILNKTAVDSMDYSLISYKDWESLIDTKPNWNISLL